MSVLVGFIPTSEGRVALEAAITEARLRGTSLTVLNASSGGSLVDPRHADTGTMAGIEQELAAAGIPHTIEHRSGRDPVDEVVDLADDPEVELLVIGLRRRSPVGKLLLGSTAQTVLMRAPCNVLAVRGKAG